MSIADVLKDCLKQYAPSVGSIKVLGINRGIENLKNPNIQVLNDSVCTVLRSLLEPPSFGNSDMLQWYSVIK